MTGTLEAEQTLRSILDALLKGEDRRFYDDLTSLAFVDLLIIGQALGEMEPAQGYDIEFQDTEGDDTVFLVRPNIPEKDIVLTATLSNVKGSWVISRVKLPGVRD